MTKTNPIYVERLINAPLDALWTYTQTPELHQQWDLRFSEITYLPKSGEEQPQRFLYKTRIGFGLAIAGEGETVGTKEKDGVLTSSLKFSSAQPISLIEKGAGYWRYVPTEGGIRFLTRYDYKTRFGPLGSWIDRVLFRPVMGWATAWSFDCLRLWLEAGVPPRLSIRRSLIELLLTVSLFAIWVYQGLVPKLLVPDSGEMEMLGAVPGFAGYERPLLTLLGLGEIAFGLLFLLLRGRARKRLHQTNLILLFILALSAAAHPAAYVAPFNPVTLNLAMIALSVISLLNAEELPSAANCRRRPPEGGNRG
ncbi:membrane protein [Paenibacillus sp. J31TS4]|uniref:DoxX-like family protein n=1 Tax=Paenibacillus sp. J31TS4 TaxID=2807195 RepID=UPI001B054B4D|nr:DoxX-like family protein [Paenibacillus sp. J31TS4]GIP40231.1 membrane protein [Paenibacillus sp. J31TS4]